LRTDISSSFLLVEGGLEFLHSEHEIRASPEFFYELDWRSHCIERRDLQNPRVAQVDHTPVSYTHLDVYKRQKFSYVFRCADSGEKVHTAMIEDWELGVLYRREVERLGDEQAAVANVRKKFFDEICGPSKDTRFFMGTVFPYNTWVVIGVFWPPKEYQPSLI